MLFLCDIQTTQEQLFEHRLVITISNGDENAWRILHEFGSRGYQYYSKKRENIRHAKVQHIQSIAIEEGPMNCDRQISLVILITAILLPLIAAPIAGAVSLQASEDLILTIPNQDLGLSPNVAQAPKVRLSRGGKVFPLTVTGFVAGADGEMTCNVPSGLEAGHYSLWALQSGKWVKYKTLVKVLAPVVNSVNVTGDALRSGTVVTLGGLFFSQTPAISISYENSEGQPVNQPCSIVGDSSVMDSETGTSQIEVQVPDLVVSAPASCVFEVESPNGSAFVYYANGGDQVTIRGQLISAVRQNTIKRKEVWDYLLASISDDWFFQRITEGFLYHTKLWNQKYYYDLQQWNISYWTVGATGGYVIASGVVIVPQGIAQSPLLSFQHGTMLMKKEAPTLSEGAELGFATTFASADGFLVSMPDHLGLGQSAYRAQMNLTHPYCEAEPLATAAADMLVAVKSFLSRQFPNLQLKNKLFLAGYSEGAYATMALHRELDTNTYADIPAVTASAPMDGPYSLSKVMLDKLMANTTFPVLYFAPYLLVAMDQTYKLYGDASLYMDFPFDMTVAPLINGYFSEQIVNSQMPAVPRNVLLPAIASQLTQYHGPIYDALLTNDLAPSTPPQGSWSPIAHLYVIHGQKDDCVPYANLTSATDYFTAVGAPNVQSATIDTVWVNLIPGTYHAAYCPFAMGMAWSWFHNMKP